MKDMHTLNKRIGIIGGGQLGKMMILEAKRLGFYVITLDPTPDCPSHSISDEHIVAEFDDDDAIVALASKVDVVTYEFEHIGVSGLQRAVDQGYTVYPSVESLRIIQDKYTQNQRLQEEGVPLPKFRKVTCTEDIYQVGEEYGYPMMLKATRGGYDGKGNALIKTKDNVEEAYASLGLGAVPLMIEEFIPFDLEVSIIACRGIDGSRRIYPVAENTHFHSILDTSIVPARISSDIAEKAKAIGEQVMEIFTGVGTFCVELFVCGENIFVNEVAPRPHNSGHYTIEGTFANQFENHIRAITGLALGSVDLIQPTVMVNLLGVESDGKTVVEGLEETYARFPNVHAHVYGKLESKIDRKMGHYTVVSQDLESAIREADLVKGILKIKGV